MHKQHSLIVLLLWVIVASLACGDDGDASGETSTPDNNAANNAPNNTANNAPNNTANNGEALPPTPWPVTEAGFYNIGYRTESLTYDSAATGEPRSIRLAYWYPTLDDDAGANVRYGGLLPRQGPVEDASVAVEGEMPVLVFSHGSNGFAEQSFFMTEFYASHGWIVVAMDHTGNAFRDGSFPPETFATRPQDVTATLDHVFSLPDEHPLAGRFSDDVLLSGHSFGGYTTLFSAGARFNVSLVNEACEQNVLADSACDFFLREDIQQSFIDGFLDPRVDVAIPQAPFGGPVFGEGVADVDIPVMLLTALGDVTLPPEQDGDPLWDGLDGADDIRVDFVTGGHFTFSDACALGVGVGDGCGPEFIAPETAHFLVNAYTMAFARKHLFDDDTNDDILDGTNELDGSIRLFFKR